MNRLILIGNGFDLAHGRKTSYNDFIVWYLKKVYKETLKTGIFDDDLLTVKLNTSTYGGQYADLVETNIDNLYRESKLPLLLSGQGHNVNQFGDYVELFKVEFASNLIKALIINCSDANWVDIERQFYKILQAILTKKESDRMSLLNDLNDSFECLIKHLEKYLEDIDPPSPIAKYIDILASPIMTSDFSNGKLKTEVLPDNTMFLNFNYTKTVEQYIANIPIKKIDSEVKVNYIHGRLKEENNPVVFGFGDELDEDYVKMEQQELNGFFNYTKSFWYSNAMNYRNLLRFIEDDEYQIYILGQSCGLSDRTLLNMLFEHQHCKSIKVFFYKFKHKEGDNYLDILHQIGRHFHNKKNMRDIIVPKPVCLKMPQFDD